MKRNHRKRSSEMRGPDHAEAPRRYSVTPSRNQGSASKNSDAINGNQISNANPTKQTKPSRSQGKNSENRTSSNNKPSSSQSRPAVQAQNSQAKNGNVSENRKSKSSNHRVSTQSRGSQTKISIAHSQPKNLTRPASQTKQKGQPTKNPVVATRYPDSTLHIRKPRPAGPVKEIPKNVNPPKLVAKEKPTSTRPSVVRPISSHAKFNKVSAITKSKVPEESVHRDQVAGPSRLMTMDDQPSQADFQNIHPNSHHAYLMSEIYLLQTQPMWAISKAKIKPNIPIPRLPPMVELLHSSHAMLIQRLIHAYAQIENLRKDEENTFDTRANTPHRSASRVRVQLSNTDILNRETELELGDECLIVRTKLPVPKGQELTVESYYSLNQTVRRPETITPSKSSCTILSETEFQKLLYEKTKEKRDSMDPTVFNDPSEMSFDESPGSPMDPYYEAILIKKTERRMLLYINPKVVFHPGLQASDGSYIPYPVTAHPTHAQMSQIYVPCFDRSKTDLELKEIFKNNPPIRHKIVRKLPRAERGSSVPALDSYYGTEDLEKVGHNSYFIPMLCADERTAIGWKPNYRYGKWKYSLQKIDSVASVNNVERVRTSTHLGPEIHVVPERPLYLRRGGGSLTSTEEQSLGSSLLLDANGPFGCFQCLFPCIFTKPNLDDEPDLLEDWMEDPDSKKTRKRHLAAMAKKSNSDAGGDIDALSQDISSVRHLPPPILVPVLGDEHTWFFDKPPPSDYNANMFAHTWNKDFGKPYPKESASDVSGHPPKNKSGRRFAQPGLSKISLKSFFKRR